MGWKVSKKRKEDQTEKTVSLLDVIFAIRENGLPQTRGKFWRRSNNTEFIPYIDDFQDQEINSACAIGMAALNLGVSWSQLEDKLAYISLDDNGNDTVRDDIITWNDSQMLSLQGIFDKLKEKYPSKFDIQIDLISDVNVVKY